MGRRSQAAAGNAAELVLPAPKRWITARPDWASRIINRQSLLPDLPLDRERADRALRIFRRLKMVEVSGQPTMGEACEQWVFDFVASIFGGYDPEARRQVIREYFLLIAKKNGKSSIAAGVMLTALIMHDRHAAEYLILAPTKDVADNSFLPAYRMVKADPALFRAYKPSDSTRVITNRLDGATLEVKSADAEVVGGQKAQCVFFDELWLFGKKASAKNVLSEAVGSLASQRDGFAIYASTQSDDPPSGVFREKLEYHRDVRDGVIEDRTALPLIYEYPKDMQESGAWKNRATWYIPNPNMGRSVDVEFIESEMQKAERAGPDSVRLVAAKHLNIQIGVGLGVDRWAGAEFWERAADQSLTFEEILKRSEAIAFGIDGGGLDDLFGFVMIGRCRQTKRWLLWSHAWCHVGVLSRRKSIATKLEGFKASGELTIVSDELEDTAEIVDIIAQVKDLGLLAGVGVDQMGLEEFVGALKAIDVTEENGLLIGIKQGGALMSTIKATERAVVSGQLKCCPSGLMDWAVSNLKIEALATTIRATKQNAGDAKIDPALAMFDAMAVMVTNPEAEGSFPADYEVKVW